MRKYAEPTARNLLRKPLILGVPLLGLIFLSFIVLTINLIGGSGKLSSSIAFRLETLLRSKNMVRATGTLSNSEISIRAPETMDESELIQSKTDLGDWLSDK